MHARFFSTPILVLNHTHTARALLEQRGDKYSSRPRFTFHEDMYVFCPLHVRFDAHCNYFFYIPLGAGRMRFWNDSVQWDHVVKMPYSDRWRCQRRWLQTALLTRRTLDTYKPLQHREVHVLLRDIARDPPEVLAHIRRYVGGWSQCGYEGGCILTSIIVTPRQLCSGLHMVIRRLPWMTNT